VSVSKEMSRVGYLGALQEARYVLWLDATRGEGFLPTTYLGPEPQILRTRGEVDDTEDRVEEGTIPAPDTHEASMDPFTTR